MIIDKMKGNTQNHTLYVCVYMESLIAVLAASSMVIEV